MARIKREQEAPNTIRVSRAQAYIETGYGFAVAVKAEIGDPCRFIIENKAGKGLQRLCEAVVAAKDGERVTVVTKHGGVARPGPACLLAVTDKKDVQRIAKECHNALNKRLAVRVQRAERTQEAANGKRVRRVEKEI